METIWKQLLSRAEMFRNVVGADTRIFSPHTVPRLCVTIGRYWYLFKRLMAVSARRFYRFEHIVADSSFKALSKQRERLATPTVVNLSYWTKVQWIALPPPCILTPNERPQGGNDFLVDCLAGFLQLIGQRLLVAWCRHQVPVLYRQFSKDTASKNYSSRSFLRARLFARRSCISRT